jgi:hypothetical protein
MKKEEIDSAIRNLCKQLKNASDTESSIRTDVQKLFDCFQYVDAFPTLLEEVLPLFYLPVIIWIIS